MNLEYRTATVAPNSLRTLHIIIVNGEEFKTTVKSDILQFVKNRNPTKYEWKDVREAIWREEPLILKDRQAAQQTPELVNKYTFRDKRMEFHSIGNRYMVMDIEALLVCFHLNEKRYGVLVGKSGHCFSEPVEIGLWIEINSHQFEEMVGGQYWELIFEVPRK